MAAALGYSSYETAQTSSGATMQVKINGESKNIDDGMTVAALVASLDLQPKFVAVERNREIVPRKQHADCTLQPGDELEIVTLVGGG